MTYFPRELGFRRLLMRLTIQLNKRPYNALAMASRESIASGTELSLTINSPLATIPVVVKDSTKSTAGIPNNLETDVTQKLC